MSSGAVATPSTASSWSSTSCETTAPSSFPDASIASLWRMPATRSRSDSVARMAAAAGLLSSWVRPAESEPRASRRSRSPIAVEERCIPMKSPATRCIASGNHSRSFSDQSAAGSASSVVSVQARSVCL